ncbi:poly polymerase catalytic domain-containing protein [Cercophora newfieldiana]|uniref:Poly [ADP-ribose] polymerase n=1 Tax=Cercophora newfieldiana TaxID=92897 RepID=A0AA39XT34_9PEZI|nr:poly polymerase catalytic domain-containing protein [Cercophora newfieldiana]
MPPKRGKKAAAATPALPALDSCKITLSGTFPGYSQAALKKKVEELGGTVSTTVTADTTHLIASIADYEKTSAKVAKAQASNIPIVSVTWLFDSETKGARAAEADYEPKADADPDDEDDDAQAPVSQALPVGANGTATTNGVPQKRAASPAPAAAATGSQPKAKKPRGRKAAKTDDDVDVKDEEDDVPAVKSKPAKPAKSKPEAAMGEGQVAKRRDIQIPLDEGCPLASSIVYIAPDGVIYDASLNQTNASNNNNKFYRIQLLVDSSGVYRTWTRWGRVGERGQTAILGGGDLYDALRQFEKKFKDKSGLAWNQRGENPKPGKYAFVERNYSVESDDEEEVDETKDKKKAAVAPPKSTLHDEVQKLMTLIFNQQFFAAAMEALNYDANKLPLGKLSKATITRGFQALKDLSALLDDNSLAANYNLPYPQAVEGLSNSYYSLIPHAFGRNRPPIINSQQMLKQEIELLESLSDMKDAALIMKTDKSDDDVHPLDKQYQGLKMEEMTPLDHTSNEFAHLKEYLMETRGATHNANYRVESIFRIERQGEKDRYHSSFGKNAKNRRLLWHGSRATNFGGILSQGLRIAPPEAPVSGYMFGKGIYLADMSSKSANYCCSYLSDNTALLLLCEAELGDPMQELTNASYNAGDDAKKKGMLSTWGKGNTGPSKWKDAGVAHPSLKGIQMPDTSVKPGPTNVPGAYLAYNEFICYDVSQVRLRYLFRVKM